MKIQMNSSLRENVVKDFCRTKLAFFISKDLISGVKYNDIQGFIY